MDTNKAERLRRRKLVRILSIRVDWCSLVVFSEPKPQQTGTGLLTRYGEVATTSGSSIFAAGSSNSRTSPFEGERGGANPSPAAIFMSSPDGETGSRLSYKQESEAQLLLGRPDFIASWCNKQHTGL